MTQEKPVQPALTLPFGVQPDLAATMDIQVPSLAWEMRSGGRFRRVYYLAGGPVTVEVTEGVDALHFFYTVSTIAQADEVETLLRSTFRRLIGTLRLDTDPRLRSLRDRYRGVVVMHCGPFEALVLTVLSQNRTGEIVREVYPRLAARCRGITAGSLAAVPMETLREIIRPVGPYKAARLAETVARVAAEGEDAFHARVMTAPATEALAYLQSFPGVGPKTAACVLVYSALSTAILPVDTHLFRVVDRLGLARHGGRHNSGTRDALVRRLLGYGPDLAPAHFLFLLLGRDTCRSAAPDCRACFLRPQCRYAAARLPRSST